MVTEILRPNGVGDLNQIRFEAGAAAPNHYRNVNEVIADNASTMVYEFGGEMLYDLYRLTVPQLTGTISSIVLHGKFMVDRETFLPLHKPEFTIKTDGSKYDFDVPGSWEASVWDYHTRELTINPKTLLAWTTNDLTSLQFGCGLMRQTLTSTYKEYCTQLWVVVTYSSIFTGGGGDIAVVEQRLHWKKEDGTSEVYMLGVSMGASTVPAGNLAVVEERLHYVDAYGDEKYWEGILIGDATNDRGNIASVEGRVHYVDTSGKERYIVGIPV